MRYVILATAFSLLMNCGFGETEMPRRVSEPDFEVQLRSEGLATWQKVVSDIKKGTTIEWTEFPDIKLVIADSNYVFVDRFDENFLVIGSNDAYEFWLEGESLEQMKIKSLREIGVSEDRNNNLAKMIDGGKHVYPNWPYSLVGPFRGRQMNLIDALNDPRFSITNAQESQLDGKPFVEFSWTFTGKPSEFPPEGEFWVDPKSAWSLFGIDWRSKTTDGRDYTGKTRFSGFQELRGSIVPQHYDYEQSLPTSESWDFRVKYSANHAREAFYVSHYGLPEPKGLGPREAAWPVWLTILLVGLGIVAGAALFRKLQPSN